MDAEAFAEVRVMVFCQEYTGRQLRYQVPAWLAVRIRRLMEWLLCVVYSKDIYSTGLTIKSPRPKNSWALTLPAKSVVGARYQLEGRYIISRLVRVFHSPRRFTCSDHELHFDRQLFIHLRKWKTEARDLQDPEHLHRNLRRCS